MEQKKMLYAWNAIINSSLNNNAPIKSEEKKQFNVGQISEVKYF